MDGLELRHEPYDAQRVARPERRRNRRLRSLPAASRRRPEVTILLPAYNEEQALPSVLEEIRAALSSTPYSYELIVVDDASTDDTAAVAARYAGDVRVAPAGRVRLVRRAVRGGAGAARKAGIRAARGDIVVMLDADGSYLPDDIPRLLAHFPQYDQVNGARTSEQGTLRYLRTPAKWFIRRLACYLTHTPIPDLNTGLKAFKRRKMLRFLGLVPNGFSCVTTMTLAFLAAGYAVKYVPVTYRPRIGTSKFHPIKDTFQYLTTVIRMVMYFNPLKVFGPLSACVLLGGLAKCIYSFRSTSTLQESDIIIVVAGFLTGMLGLLADIIVAQHRR